MRLRARSYVVVAALTAALQTACDSAPRDPQLRARIAVADSLVAAAVDSLVVPGAVLSVSKSGWTLFEKAYGNAQLFAYGGKRLADPEPVTTSHLFDLASLTKVLATTAAVMALVDQDKLDLDAKVGGIIDDFRGLSKDSVTVRHLLTHTGGLFPWKPIYYHSRTADSSISYVARLPLAFPVGEGRRYSDLGFMLLGGIVERTGGRGLDDFLGAEVYGPLQLESIMFRPRDRRDGPFAATSHGNPFERRMVEDDDFGYDVDEDPDSFTSWREYVLVGEVNDGNAHHAFEGVAGHAGLFATASDVQAVMSLLLNRGQLEGQRIVDEKVVDEFLTPTALGNGLGWLMSPALLGLDNLPEGTFFHTGFTGTFALGDPTTGVSIVLLTNRQNLGVGPDGRYNSVGSLRREVSKAVLGLD